MVSGRTIMGRSKDLSLFRLNSHFTLTPLEDRCLGDALTYVKTDLKTQRPEAVQG
jgi:hypothetical protein